MAFYSFRWRFGNRQNKRSWTEQWTNDMGTLGRVGIEGEIRRQAATRVGALVVGNYMIDATYWPVLSPKETTLIPINLEGRSGDLTVINSTDQDVVNVSLLIQLSAASGRRRQYLMRGIPDADFVNGSYQPRPTWFPQMQRWLDSITSAPPYQIRTSVFTPIAVPILTIAANVITFTSAIPTTATGTLLAIRTRVAGNGPRVTARVLVLAPTTGATASVRWPHGNCEGGDARVVAYVQSSIVSLVWRQEGRTRKTGGPLTRFRGRR